MDFSKKTKQWFKIALWLYGACVIIITIAHSFGFIDLNMFSVSVNYKGVYSHAMTLFLKTVLVLSAVSAALATVLFVHIKVSAWLDKVFEDRDYKERR